MSQTIEILHVVPSFGFGGMEKVICSIINLTSEIYHHKILSLDEKNEAMKWINSENVKFSTFKRPRRNFSFFIKLYRTLKEINPDLLMTYNWGATDAIWLGRIGGINKIVHNEHGFNIDESNIFNIKRILLRFFIYRLTDGIIVVSKRLKHIMKNIYLINEGRLHFIYNGIDTDIYTAEKTDYRKIREEIGLKDTDFTIGFSGRLDPVKNFKLMIKIIEYCIDRDEDFKLLIVGDGSEKNNIEKICREKNIQKNVILVGKKENVVPYLRSLDVFLLTSSTEQTPMTILEAMSMEIPVIATNVGDIPDIIDNEKDGFVVGLNKSAKDFALPLFALKNHEKRRVIGKSARNKIVNKFQQKAMVKKYTELIESVLRCP
jgi:glycosyltransferase involved in cell wall biosynthesis